MVIITKEQLVERILNNEQLHEEIKTRTGYEISRENMTGLINDVLKLHGVQLENMNEAIIDLIAKDIILKSTEK